MNERSIFTILFLCALFIRFPFFFRDYIDRDESTFILMAQSWVDGHLPYTELWDLKPPIIFLFFAILIKFFGKSFIIIRLAGAILVAFTSYFTFKIGVRISTKKTAFWVAISTVILQSLFGSLQGVMSEHIAIFFFVIGTYVLVSKKKWSWLIISGLFMGLSLMSKLNIAYPILFLFLYLFWEAAKLKKIKHVFFHLFLIGVGITIIVFLTALPYLYENQLMIWWQSVFMAPMAYSIIKPGSLFGVVGFFLIISIWQLISFKKGWLDFNKREIRILAVVSFGMLFSFLQTGKLNGHYLILVYPFLLILVGVFLENTTWFKKLNRPLLIGFILLLVPMEAYLEYVNIVDNKALKGTFFNGEGIEVPKYITKNNLSSKSVLFFEYHIGYWLLDKKPPTKAATHPSNILRESMFPYMQNTRTSGMDELQYLMENSKPELVVTRRNRRVFDKQEEQANVYINTYLKNNYQKLDSVEGAMIYKRLE